MTTPVENIWVKMLPAVQARLIQSNVEIPAWHATEVERTRFASVVAQTIVEMRLDRQNGQTHHVAEAATQIAGMMTGIGVLNPLLSDAETDEIIVRNGRVLRDRSGSIEDLGVLADDTHFAQVADRVADQGQRMMTGQRPYVLVDLPGGDRFTAIKPPLSLNGTAINIRHFKPNGLTLADLEQRGTFDAPVKGATPADERFQDLSPLARFLAQIAARNLASILVSGEFGSGKTTLLSALTQYVPPQVQMAVVESFSELKIGHPNPLRVAVPERDRAEREAVSMDDVLNVVITRMRPDLLIVGEIVRDEAARFLDAINLGKRAWSTIHGNDALGALYRLETKALATGLPHQAIREQIAAGVNLVVHLRRDTDTGRRSIAQIAHVSPQLVDGRYALNLVWDTQHETGTGLTNLLEELKGAAWSRPTTG